MGPGPGGSRRTSPMTHLRVTVSGVRNRTHVVYVASWLRHAVVAHGGPATLVEINGAGRISDEIARCDGLLADIDVRLVEHHSPTSAPHYFVSIGSPGTMRSMKKTRVATTNMTSRAPSKRRVRNIPMDISVVFSDQLRLIRRDNPRLKSCRRWGLVRSSPRSA